MRLIRQMLLKVRPLEGETLKLRRFKLIVPLAFALILFTGIYFLTQRGNQVNYSITKSSDKLYKFENKNKEFSVKFLESRVVYNFSV